MTTPKAWIEQHFTVQKWTGDEARIRCPEPGHTDEHPSCDANVKKKTFLCRACGATGTFRDLAKLAGVPYLSGNKRDLERSISYEYHDENGELLYQVVRKPGKDFWCQKPDGKGGWIKKDIFKGAHAVPRVPYRLPYLLKGIEDGAAVIVTEGEKDALTLASLGCIATSNHGGAGNWTAEHTKWFKEGTEVYLCGDADEPGVKHMNRVGRTLSQVKCNVKVIDLGFPIDDGKDISDWVTQGNGKDDFAQLMLAAQPWRRPDLDALLTSMELSTKQFPALRWITQGILPDAGLGILAGKPKLGKSWFALQLACSLSAGGMMLGSIQVPNMRVLYLALEDTERRLQDRMEKLDAFPSDHLFLATRWPKGKEGRELLRDYIEDYRLNFVIIDTLFRIRGEATSNNQYQVDYDDCNSLKEIADEYGISILALHHVNKRLSNDPLELISGTFGLSGSADTLMVMTRTRGEADAELYVEGRDVESTDLALRLDLAAKVGWELIGSAEEHRASKADQDVLTILGETTNPMSLKEISASTEELSYSSIQHSIRRLVKRGEVVKRERGRYVLNRLNG